MNQEEAAFTYLREKILRLSEAKFKLYIFLVHKYETLSRTKIRQAPSRRLKAGLGQF